VAEQKRLQSLLRKVCRDVEVTCCCRLFQMREAATGNVPSSTVDSRDDGTISELYEDDDDNDQYFWRTLASVVKQVSGFLKRS